MRSPALALLFALLAVLGASPGALAYGHGFAWKRPPAPAQVEAFCQQLAKLPAARPAIARERTVLPGNPEARGGLDWVQPGLAPLIFPGPRTRTALATDRAEQDAVITAALLRARQYFDEELLVIDSDGAWAEWKDGLTLYREVYGYGPVDDPVTREPRRAKAEPKALPSWVTAALIGAAMLLGVILLIAMLASRKEEP